MTYQDLIQRLLAVNLHGGMKMGLQNMQRLQRLFHYPDREFVSIHVAGTNGKGSVCIKIAHALEMAGYRVGVFTSPHISCFRERIRINETMISEKAIEAILPSLFQSLVDNDIPATFFEITTFLALIHFAQEKVDFAILETGLGGRLDATNIVTPCLSIITSISLDHTEILGTTQEAIATEKGGIIKEKVPVIIGPHVHLEAISKIATQKCSPLLQVKESSKLFEEHNRAVARSALEYLSSQFSLSPQAITRGLQASQPCRLEVLPGPPLLVLDVAHNPDGIYRLFETLIARYPKQSFRLLFGLSKTKDVKGCLEQLIPFGSHYHLVEARNGRGVSKEILKSKLEAFSVAAGDISCHPTVADGVHHARIMALKDDQVLIIFGTFFIMSDVRRALNYLEPFDIFDLNERNIEKSKE